ncbi:MAG: tyrosine-type recombinase/integrase [Planctomycetes bacterium]|nr:tyrosine-type recombinase/integrase [Planctomycetota bacterium]
MPRSRPASNPISFHKPTGQFYVTRAGRRIYLGADEKAALAAYYDLVRGESPKQAVSKAAAISAKELANRFLASQRSNWRNAGDTSRAYEDWLRRFLKDHPGLMAGDFTVESFAAWKESLRRRKYAPQSINHYLNVVRAMFLFAEDAELLDRIPRLRRVKNESRSAMRSPPKALYTTEQIQKLIAEADGQVKLMILLALNCGFGPKDLQDLRWDHFQGGRITLPRSKTGICQTYRLWPETLSAMENLRADRESLIERMAKRERIRSDAGHVFVTKFWHTWHRDAISQQFEKLCRKAAVPCLGLYRLRHGASTAISMVATPHVQRRFMRHAQLQQQVTYTHTPDAEVDAAVMASRGKLLGAVNEDQERSLERADVA